MRSRGVLFSLIALFAAPLLAQQSRIRGPIDARRTVVLGAGAHPLARREFDRGPVDPSFPIHYASLIFKRSASQQAALDSLLAELQNPASPEFHKWLTPEQFAERFGPSASDAGKIADWLRSQGLVVNQIARGGGWIAFSGTAGNIQNAFHTEIRHYSIHGETHFINAEPPSVPAAIAPLVEGIRGLNDLHPHVPELRPLPKATSPDGSHSLAPGDLAAIYDLNPLYKNGVDGTGQNIAIVGESDIDLLTPDLQAFRIQYNLPPNTPNVVTYGPDPGITPALVEAALDVEWAGAVARNATITYVAAQDFLSASQYAIDQDLAPVVSASYGFCEQEMDGSSPFEIRSIAQQASAEGITWVVASGDSGAASCDSTSAPAAVNGLATSFPATIPEITAVGGTEFNDASGNYWSATNDANGASALGYIPETAWNETAQFNALASGGGGASIFFTKPDWQLGPGVPADGARDVPDIALSASVHDGYAISIFGTQQSVGGTSGSTPSFAGILALLNEYLTSTGAQRQAGLGNINPTLYRLAQGGGNMFHDITAGNNIVPCAPSTLNCIGNQFGYSAGPGYDEATGLGSVDGYNLVTGWGAPASATAVSLTANPPAMTLSGSTQITATVSSPGSSVPPGGTVTLYLGANPIATGTLNQGAVTLAVYGAELSLGSNTIVARYGGNGNFLGSLSSANVQTSVAPANSEVVPSITPTPVFEQAPDANGNTWTYAIVLTERGGFATTLTDFSIDGVSYAAQIPSLFGSASLPAFGTLFASMGDKNLPYPSTRIFSFSGRDAGGFQWTQKIPVTFLGPQFNSFIYGAGNAASGDPAAAPGMLLSLYGVNLAGDSVPESGVSATSLPLPQNLGGVTATVNGVAAPLWYVSAYQLNIQIPYETQVGDAIVTINNGGQTSSIAVTIAAAAPGIFTDLFGEAVPYADGARGQTLTLFITGAGAVSPPLADGATPDPSTPVAQLPAPVAPITMTIGGVSAPIDFAGIPSGNVGVTQVNFTVPDTAPLGLQEIVVTAGTARSEPASFEVTPAARQP